MRVLFACAIAVSVAGCSIYPSPEKVTGLDPFAIERRIRCETQVALQDKAIALLKASPGTFALAESLENNRLLFRRFTSFKFDSVTAPYVQKYLSAAIAYEFTFDITEDNEADGVVDIVGPITGGVFKLNAKAGTDLSRQGVSHFQASDLFGKLIESDLHCDSDPGGPNYIYPITGTIGISNPLRQFIDLNEFGNLSGADKVPTYAATFNFVTMFNGSLNPQVTLSPIRGLADASLNGSAKRTDMHKVIVGFSLPIPKEAKNGKSRAAGGASLLGPATLSAGNKTATEIRAFEAIQKFKLDNFLAKGTVLVTQ